MLTKCRNGQQGVLMEAFLYKPLKGNRVRCDLCAHHCVVKDGEIGICGVRENRSGRLYSTVYGKLVAANIDPIEKKPLFHLMPGSRSFSIATIGCNLKCRFCQNADIAQVSIGQQGVRNGTEFSPEQIVAAAVKENCASIAYTYTEPTVFFEFAYHTAKLATEKGIKNVFVTNGFMSADALEMIKPYLTAANVDLKAFTDDFYRDYCGARIAPVKETLKQMKAFGILVEVTTLVIPGLNDGKTELKNIADFIAGTLGDDTPWHVSRFHPTHKLTHQPPTPVDTLISARKIGINAGLKYVYTGNIPGHGGEDTICHECGKPIIERSGFLVTKTAVKRGKCQFCGEPIAGIWM